jgi:opacity protein-like surface antigen
MTTKFVPVLAGAAALVSAATPAFASGKWYAGLSAGATTGNKLKTSEGFKVLATDTNTTSFDLKRKMGSLYSVAVGYRAMDHVRLEAEVLHSSSRFNPGQFQFSDTPVTYNTDLSLSDARQDLMGFMVNGHYDFSLNDRWSLSLGAGVGLANVKLDGDVIFSQTAAGGVVSAFDGSLSRKANVFAYQFMLGPVYKINDSWEVFAQYRLLGTAKPKHRMSINAIAGGAALAGFPKDVTFKAAMLHSVVAGVRVSF